MKEEITKIKLPSKFEDFNETRKNGFLKMKELKESGQKVAGIFCTYTPQEMIYAAGLIPAPKCAVKVYPERRGNAHLPVGVVTTPATLPRPNQAKRAENP